MYDNFVKSLKEFNNKSVSLVHSIISDMENLRDYGSGFKLSSRLGRKKLRDLVKLCSDLKKESFLQESVSVMHSKNVSNKKLLVKGKKNKPAKEIVISLDNLKQIKEDVLKDLNETEKDIQVDAQPLPVGQGLISQILEEETNKIE